MSKPITKNICQQELEQDWYPNRPGQPVDARINRIASGTNTRQQKLIEKAKPMDKIPEPNVTTVYAYKNKLWQVVGFRCMDCGKLMSDLNIIQKHPQVCSHGLKINKQEEEEILKLVRKDSNANS